MRRVLTFACEGVELRGTLDDAPGTTALLIVSGGNEIRIGAHRGMAKLAQDVAAQGFPVFRFDRRGIGDSEGENAGFEESAADISAAVGAIRQACPSVTRIVAFGNCDAASALMIRRPQGIDAAIIGNPWVVEAAEGDALPPAAAIKSYYWQKLKDPAALLGLISGKVNFRRLAGGLMKTAQRQSTSPLADRVGAGLAAFAGPVTILLARNDGTAAAFADQWKRPPFAQARTRGDVSLIELDSSSHSFASDADYAALRGAILEMLARN